MRQRTLQASAPLRRALATPSSSLARCAPIALQPTNHARFASTSAKDLKKTPLYDFHKTHGANLVPFADHHLPIAYAGQSLAQSHHFTRDHASLFDVSHMVQHIFKGPAAAAFLEKVAPGDFSSQGAMQGKLTTLLWRETGGIVDDGIVTRLGEDEYHVVTNGANLEKDSKFIDEELGRFGGGVQWTRLDNSGLVALQGPQAAEILSELVSGVDLKTLYFGNAAHAEIKVSSGETYPVLITRGGYTGEDGFELSFASYLGSTPDATPLAAETLLSKGGAERIQLAGLGARDSLRLEAGMCLYGNDIDDTTTPVEAALAFVIPKHRRESGGFNGAEIILPQLTPKSKGGAGVSRRRAGFVVEGAPARAGAGLEVNGENIGTVTSGAPSPTLGKNIAMGYVKDGMHKAGTEVDVVVRGKKRKGVVTKMPFVPPHYYKGDA